MASWLQLHATIRRRLREGRSREDVWRELAPTHPQKKLVRALRGYPERAHLARYAHANALLGALLALALVVKLATFATLAPMMLELGASPWSLLVAPLPLAILFALVIWSLRDGWAAAYRAAMFLGAWTFLQMFTGATTNAPYALVETVVAVALIGLALFLHVRLLEKERWFVPHETA